MGGVISVLRIFSKRITIMVREREDDHRRRRSPERDRRDRERDRGDRDRRDGRDRDRDRRRVDEPRRRSRSPLGRSRGRRSMSPSERYKAPRSPTPETTPSGPKATTGRTQNIPEQINEAELTEEEKQMREVMGFCTFDTTQGKHLPGNDAGAVHVTYKRKYRQYMNRRGGFNRPLDYVT